MPPVFMFSPARDVLRFWNYVILFSSVSEGERECGCVGVCVGKKVRERECMCVCMRERGGGCVCEGERVRECVCA